MRFSYWHKSKQWVACSLTERPDSRSAGDQIMVGPRNAKILCESKNQLEVLVVSAEMEYVWNHGFTSEQCKSTKVSRRANESEECSLS